MNKLNIILSMSLAVVFFFVSGCTVPAKLDNDILNFTESRMDVDTVNTIYYLNGKEVPRTTFSTMSDEDQSKLDGRGAGSGKQAIRLYGEKYRNGVVFFKLLSK